MPDERYVIDFLVSKLYPENDSQAKLFVLCPRLWYTFTAISICKHVIIHEEISNLIFFVVELLKRRHGKGRKGQEKI